MAATTDVEICNSALRKLGVATITALSDDTDGARACNGQYDKIRDRLLREHPWNFAVKRVALVLTVNTPAFGYTYEFSLPSDCLRILETDPEDSEWQREGATVVSNDSVLSVRYIAKITDVTKFDTGFAELLALELAHDICYTLTVSNTLKEQLMQEIKDRKREARTMDAQEGQIRQIQANQWRNSRY